MDSRNTREALSLHISSILKSKIKLHKYRKKNISSKNAINKGLQLLRNKANQAMSTMINKID